MVKKLSDLYLEARKMLLATEDAQDASRMARDLLCHVTGRPKDVLLADGSLLATEEECAAMDFAVNRVRNGEPLAYVLGEWEFYGMPLKVDRDVLIPRDDTVAVAELAIRYGLFLSEKPRILDLCTGTGCIGLALASRLPDAKVTLADISPKALAVARQNMTGNHLSARVSCVQADALGEPPAFLGKFDMIVSNPPYITTAEMAELPHSVKDFEPALALHGGDDGLDFYRSIGEHYTKALKKGGYLCLEFGMGQGDDVCRILTDHGYTILERTRDYNDRERALIAQRKDD